MMNERQQHRVTSTRNRLSVGLQTVEVKFRNYKGFSSGSGILARSESPPLKLKRVISQKSIDSISSNYSSSQQKRENLRYKRSDHHQWQDQEIDNDYNLMLIDEKVETDTLKPLRKQIELEKD
jgi:hypothetical protein